MAAASAPLLPTPFHSARKRCMHACRVRQWLQLNIALAVGQAVRCAPSYNFLSRSITLTIDAMEDTRLNRSPVPREDLLLHQLALETIAGAPARFFTGRSTMQVREMQVGIRMAIHWLGDRSGAPCAGYAWQ
eukprot:363712-Chlamydomonas_euryale.AAC.4